MTFAQQRCLAQMHALGAEPLACRPDQHDEVLVLVRRGDGLPELKTVDPAGRVRSITRPHEDRGPLVS